MRLRLAFSAAGLARHLGLYARPRRTGLEDRRCRGTTHHVQRLHGRCPPDRPGTHRAGTKGSHDRGRYWHLHRRISAAAAGRLHPMDDDARAMLLPRRQMLPVCWRDPGHHRAQDRRSHVAPAKSPAGPRGTRPHARTGPHLVVVPRPYDRLRRCDAGYCGQPGVDPPPWLDRKRLARQAGNRTCSSRGQGYASNSTPNAATTTPHGSNAGSAARMAAIAGSSGPLCRRTR